MITLSSPQGKRDALSFISSPLFRKTSTFISIIVLLFIFKPVKAETYYVLELTETKIQIAYEGMNLGLWPFNYTDLYVYINMGTEYEEVYKKRVYTRNFETWNIKYRGVEGSNTFHTKAVLGGITPYGPYYRFSFPSQPLGKPKNVTASYDEINQITLNWDKSTDYADNEVKYKIYENGTLKKTVDGDERSTTLTGMSHGEEHSYRMETILLSSTRHSDYVDIDGSSFNFNLSATTDEVNKVIVRWDQPKDYTGNYKLSRNDVDLAEVGNSISSYIDDAALSPGIYEKYEIIALGETSQVDYTYGRSRPNGVFSGKVTTPYGDPIGGVTIKIERIDLPEDTVQKVFYATSAADDGSFSNDRIYYGLDGAEFIIVPMFNEHMFDPDTLTKTLTPNVPEQGGMLFKDTTALAVKGQVLNMGCPTEGVEIWVDGLNRGVLTDQDGNYIALVDQPGDHMIEARLDGHSFDPPAYNPLAVLDDINGVDFEDTTKYLLKGYFSASCNTFIGVAELRFYTDGACIDTSFTISDTGYYEVALPPREYNVEVLSFVSADEDIVLSDDVMDYFIPAMSIDLGNEAVYDSTLEMRVANYNLTYRLPPVLTASFLGRSESCDGNLLILEQNREYELVFEVNEIFHGNNCHADEGYIVVEQDLTSENLEVDTVWFSAGAVDTVIMKIGVPNVIDPYMKSFWATAYVGNQSDMVEYDALVIGHKPRSSTFTTVSPSIPFLILHDPPGDGSSSFMEESTSTNYKLGISLATEDETTIFAGVKAGVELIKGQFVMSTTDQELTTEAGVTVGIGINSESEFETSVTTTRNFSTDGNDNLVGQEGDVYFGGALNLIYALTDVIEYDFDACEVKKTVTLCMEPDGFATTFMYTESHIADVLIPQLSMIRDLYLATGNDSAFLYDKQISEWQQVVDNNHQAIEDATFVENISISGGTAFSSSLSSTSSFAQTISTSLSIGTQAKIEFSLEESGSGFNVGLEHQFKFEIGTSGTIGTSSTHTTGYTLYDDDDGDFLSIDVLTDQVYGTPAFNLTAGTSSCPWEDNTQPREVVQLRADHYYQYMEDPSQEAVFRLQLGNGSESDEDRTYNLIFDPTSNPDGALITIGGSPVVGNVPTPFEIPAGESVYATVTVKKGPYSSEYRNLRFILESPCDGGINDEVYLSAEFKSDCGTIVMTPDNRINVVDGEDDGLVGITLSDYTKASLNTINIQLRTDKSDWSNHMILVGDDIGDTETEVDVPFINLDDEIYYIQAVAMCSSDAILSDVAMVTVDRTAPVVLQVNPYDGGLFELGDEIAILYDEVILPCAEEDITLQNLTSSSEVEFQFGCSNNKIIILPNVAALSDGDSLEVTVSNISDIYGNSGGTHNWSFSMPDVEILEDPLLDSDNDGIINDDDNCMLVYNPDQMDLDEDGDGDACDDDLDGDGIDNYSDNCPFTANENQEDMDQDGIGDVCDEEVDGDAIENLKDNCPYVSNENQDDIDMDGIGNLCDDDMDGDGEPNSTDNCVEVANPDQADADEDGIGDVCDEVSMREHPFQNATVRTYPNPFTNELNYEFELEEMKDVKIELCNTLGQVIQINTNKPYSAGFYTGKMETSGLKPGIYYVNIWFGEERLIEKLIKIE